MGLLEESLGWHVHCSASNTIRYQKLSESNKVKCIIFCHTILCVENVLKLPRSTPAIKKMGFVFD